MTALQKGVVLGAIVLAALLYFGFSNKPPQQKKIEAQRKIQSQSTSAAVLLKEAKENLSETQRNQILALEEQIAQVPNDTLRIELTKRLSGAWYDLGHPELAGIYAEQIAERESTAESWGIAGTTYSICLQRAEVKKITDFCSSKAVSAFESAISLEPEEVEHRLNLALIYTERPPTDNPMKGILMLVDLNKKNPDNVPVLVNLGRLALQTGQIDKAVERLERAVQLEPSSKRATCLLSDVYLQKGDQAKAKMMGERCAGM